MAIYRNIPEDIYSPELIHKANMESDQAFQIALKHAIANGKEQLPPLKKVKVNGRKKQKPKNG